MLCICTCIFIHKGSLKENKQRCNWLTKIFQETSHLTTVCVSATAHAHARVCVCVCDMAVSKDAHRDALRSSHNMW